MITRDIDIRVRYSETDNMGIVHHSNYVCYYEIARTEMLREFGTTYRELENSGIMMPVLDMECHYIKPAHYDDLLTVRVTLAKLPTVRIRFDYQIFRGDELLNIGSVTLAFIHAETRRACRAPQFFLDLIAPHF